MNVTTVLEEKIVLFIADDDRLYAYTTFQSSFPLTWQWVLFILAIVLSRFPIALVMTSKLGMQYAFLINYAQQLGQGLHFASMHPFFCDRARVTCHPRLPWPSQITAFSFTCCPFPLTGYFFDLLNWGMPDLKLWMYIDTADHHQNGYACTLSILADVNFGSFAHKHLGWLPVTLCRYDLPLTLCTQPLSPYRLF